MRNTFLYLAGLLLLASCETVVELDLDESSKNLVSQSVLEFEQGLDFGVATVELTETTAFFSGISNPIVSGALVIINDIYILEEVYETGIYINDSIPFGLDEDYKLSIEAEINGLNGIWEGADEFALLAPIDTFYITFEQGNSPFTEDGYFLKIGFKDPADEVNFYLNELKVIRVEDNESTNLQGFEFRPYNDELVNGYYLEGPVNDIAYHLFDTVDFKFSGISESSYSFYENIFQLTFQTLDIVTSPPFPIRGNLISQNENFDNALGNFKVKNVFKKHIVIGE
mgnify:CR=1 FL=1